MKKQKGTITPALMVISGAFIIAIYGLLFVLTLQFDYSQRQVSSEQALSIAEAGIEYYKWHLIKSPGDYRDGTEEDGPYIHEYKDPQGDVVGEYSLDIAPPTQANPIITVSSTGKTKKHQKVKRKITAQFGQVSLTAFAFVHNVNLWFGEEVTVNGPVFSNGGIRQDGVNTSTIQSSKATYTCGLETGCTHPEIKPGVWGKGGPQELWEFPVTPIDFSAINANFGVLKISAQDGGLYLAPSGDQGYHIVFNSNGTFSVYKVTGTDYYNGYTLEDGCETLYQKITSEVLLGNTYSISDTNLVFVEDDLWIEGTIKGKITVAAAKFPLETYKTTIWLPNSLIYFAKDGNHNLGLISQNDIIFNRDVPEVFEVNGALLAQEGRITRHHYNYFSCKTPGAGTDLMKEEFIFYGSMISGKSAYWNFSSGPKSPACGFQTATITFDPDLANSPPGFFPATQLRQIGWKEEKI